MCSRKPWAPKSDFEEEIVNLQPDHDFIFGALSEPEFSYPRPQSHTEYAATKKTEEKQRQKEFEATGRINGSLHVIQQVQRMASTKPVGEQPTLDDWENNEKLEQETIGMMRYCGLGVSLEQPLNEKVTIASHPVENKIKVTKNGRRNVALFFDDNVFKLHEKVSDTSSGFESCTNSGSNNLKNIKDDSSISEVDGDTSFNTSSSLNSFSTAGEFSDSFSSVSSCTKATLNKINEQRFHQYEKLLEDTSILSLDSDRSKSSRSTDKHNCESFKTAEENSFWKPVFEDEEFARKKENWPKLSKKNLRANNDFIYNNPNDSNNDVSSEEISSNQVKRENFLNRFIKPDNVDNLDTTSDSTSTNSQEPTSYASITKTSKVLRPDSSAKRKENKKKSLNSITDFPNFYTTRKMYALKRNAK